MSNPSTFVQCLKAFESDKVNAESLQKLRKYTGNPKFISESVTPAINVLSSWVLAVEQYTSDRLGKTQEKKDRI
jgi:hypothetical protein